MTTKVIEFANTPLERHVARWVDARTPDYDGDVSKVFGDLFYGGCQSGMVGHLIYFCDTVKFYRKFRSEIDALLTETMNECGVKSPSELFGEKWDETDPFAREVHNRNLLAWFGFEETAQELANRIE